MTASSATRQLNRVCPVLLVRDVPTSLAFYRDRLGFRVKVAHGDRPEFAIIGREGCDIFLKRADVPFEARHRQYVKGDWFYDAIFTANGAASVDALFNEFSAAGMTDAEPPHTEHGMRVFSFLDPDGYKFWVHAMID